MPAGIDPVSLGSQGVQGVIGLAQTVIGGIKQKKALRSLERLQTPGYTPNKAVGDYYQSALNRYNTSPYQSAEYNYALQRNRENAATAIAGLQDRRSALAGISAITNASNNAAVSAGIQAERQRQSAFGALGNATGLKLGDDRFGYNQNVVAPYEKRFGLLSSKASAAGQLLNAGLTNTFNALGNTSAIASANNMYGGINNPNANYSSYGALQRNPLSGSYDGLS